MPIQKVLCGSLYADSSRLHCPLDVTELYSERRFQIKFKKKNCGELFTTNLAAYRGAACRLIGEERNL